MWILSSFFSPIFLLLLLFVLFLCFCSPHGFIYNNFLHPCISSYKVIQKKGSFTSHDTFLGNCFFFSTQVIRFIPPINSKVNEEKSIHNTDLAHKESKIMLKDKGLNPIEDGELSSHTFGLAVLGFLWVLPLPPLGKGPFTCTFKVSFL